jgi:hypothetical protein
MKTEIPIVQVLHSATYTPNIFTPGTFRATNGNDYCGFGFEVLTNTGCYYHLNMSVDKCCRLVGRMVNIRLK